MRVCNHRCFALFAMVAPLSWIFLSGCGKSKEDGPAAPALAVNKSSIAAPIKAVNRQTIANIRVLPFKDAVLLEPPEGERRPPDKTVAGKNVATLFEQIGGIDGAPGLWDKITLTTPEGTPIRYKAVLMTDLGNIEIELFAQAAPNHVRNFIALAQAGYYNGLSFYRSISETSDGETLAYLEGGCPLDTGEFGMGSIGYWLKPEFAPGMTHEEGTVGAVHGEDVESAACKFYINPRKSPRDGRQLHHLRQNHPGPGHCPCNQ